MKIAIIALVIITALFIVGCSDVDVSIKDKELPGVEAKASVEINTGDIDSDIEIGVEEETPEVAAAKPASGSKHCDDIDCFEPLFKVCEENVTLTSSDFGGLVYKYTIIGEKGNRCEVKSVYEKNPNPEWEGLEMLCRLDTTLDFKTAIMTFEDCEGELYEKLNS